MKKKSEKLGMKWALMMVMAVTLSMLCSGRSMAAGDVEINQSTFSDDRFRAYVSEQIDADHNGSLSVAEQQAVKVIRFSGQDALSLKGIEYFTKLEDLYCSGNKLTSLNLWNNPELKNLTCDNNQIRSLDLTKNAKIERVYCNNNGMEVLSLSQNGNLRYLYCYGNYLKMVNARASEHLLNAYVSGNPDQSYWQCNVYASDTAKLAVDKGQFVTFEAVEINATNFPDQGFRQELSKYRYDLDLDGFLDNYEISKVTYLYLDGTNVAITNFKGLEKLSSLLTLHIKKMSGLKSIDLSANQSLREVTLDDENLEQIILGNQPNLQRLTIYPCKLKQLDVTKAPALRSLYCGKSELSSLNVTQCPNLVSLSCIGTNLTQINLSKNTELLSLSIQGNSHFDSINLSANVKLTDLYFQNCKLASLDVSMLPNLDRLVCSRNQLTKLDVSQNKKLRVLNCGFNPITSLDLTQNTKLVSLEAKDVSVNSIQLNSENLNYLTCYPKDGIMEVDVGNCPKIRRTLYEYDSEQPNSTGYVYYSMGYDTYVFFDLRSVRLKRVVKIDAEQFPDSSFRSFILNNVDADGDGWLDSSELAGMQVLNVNRKNIASLEGIRFFRSLVSLEAFGNRLTEVDLGNNLILERLNVGLNNLTALDVSHNTALYSLKCYGNQIAALDVRKCPELFKAIREGTKSNGEQDGISIVRYELTGGDKLLYVDQSTVLTGSNPAIVTVINETTFPDETFRNYVKATFDENSDGKLDANEIEDAEEIRFNVVRNPELGAWISDFTGIEWFTELKKFTVYYDPAALKKYPLAALNFSNNTKLENVCLGGFYMPHDSPTIDAPTLKELYVYESNFDNLTGIKADQLEYLNIQHTALRVYSLKPTQYPKLNRLYLYLDDCGVHQVDLSGNPLLQSVGIHSNRNIVFINLNGCSRLEDLSVIRTGVGSLDCGACTALKTLRVYENYSLTELDLSSCKELEDVDCHDNRLQMLNVAGLEKLDILYCNDNRYLTTLDLTGLVNLWDLECQGNRIEWLNLEESPLLAELVKKVNPEETDGTLFYWGTVETADGSEYCYLKMDAGVYVPEGTSSELPLNAVFFPDKAFRNYLSGTYDRDGSGTLSSKEIGNIILLELDGKGITNLEGIQYLEFVAELNCRNNKLTSLDLSDKKYLKNVSLDGNQLTSLLLPRSGLEYLSVADNRLGELDLGENSDLMILYADGNPLEDLDVRENSCFHINAAYKHGTRDESHAGYYLYKLDDAEFSIDRGVRLITEAIPYTYDSMPMEEKYLELNTSENGEAFMQAVLEGKDTYQWFADGKPIAGANQVKLDLDASLVGKVVYAKVYYDDQVLISAKVTVIAAPRAKVTYDFGGRRENVTQEVIIGKNLEEQFSEDVPGWLFGGWYYDEAFGTPVEFPMAVDENVTLHAKWMEELKGVSLTFAELIVGEPFRQGDPSSYLEMEKASDDGGHYKLSVTSAWSTKGSGTGVNLNGKVEEGKRYAATFRLTADEGYAFPDLESPADKAAFLKLRGGFTGLEVRYPENGVMSGDAYVNWKVDQTDGQRNQSWTVTIYFTPRIYEVPLVDVMFEELIVGDAFQYLDPPKVKYALDWDAKYHVVTSTNAQPKWRRADMSTEETTVQKGKVYIAELRLLPNDGYRFAFPDGNDVQAITDYVKVQRYGTDAYLDYLTDAANQGSGYQVTKLSDGSLKLTIRYVAELNDLELLVESRKDDVTQEITYFVDDESTYIRAQSLFVDGDAYVEAYEADPASIQCKWYLNGKFYKTTVHDEETGKKNEVKFSSADSGKMAYVVMTFGSKSITSEEFMVLGSDECIVKFELDPYCTGEAPASQVVKIGNTVTKPADPQTTNGWAFDHWAYKDNQEVVFDFNTPVEDNLTLVAYTVKLYEVSFDANGGNGSMESVMVGMNHSWQLPECGFLPPDGMEFDCWSIFDAWNAQSTNYVAGDSYVVTQAVTVKAIWKEAEAKVPADVDAVATNLDGKVGLLFYVTMPDYVLADEGAYATLTLNAKDGDVTETQLVKNAPHSPKGSLDRWQFSYYVVAKQMHDKITLNLYLSDGTRVPLTRKGEAVAETGYAYSVIEYCDLAIANSSNAKMVTLAKRLKAYGEMAQIYFDYRAEGLVPDADFEKDLFGGLAAYAEVTSGECPAGLVSSKPQGMVLILEEETTLRVNWKFETGADPNSYEYMIDDAPATLQHAGSDYFLAVKNISSKKLGDAHKFTISKDGKSYTWTGSALTWANAAVSKGGANTKNMGKALYLYNQAAREYFNY